MFVIYFAFISKIYRQTDSLLPFKKSSPSYCSAKYCQFRSMNNLHNATSNELVRIPHFLNPNVAIKQTFIAASNTQIQWNVFLDPFFSASVAPSLLCRSTLNFLFFYISMKRSNMCACLFCSVYAIPPFAYAKPEYTHMHAPKPEPFRCYVRERAKKFEAKSFVTSTNGNLIQEWQHWFGFCLVRSPLSLARSPHTSQFLWKHTSKSEPFFSSFSFSFLAIHLERFKLAALV